MLKITIVIAGLCTAVVAAFLLFKLSDDTHLADQNANIQRLIESANAGWAKFDIIDDNVILSGRTIDKKKHEQLIHDINQLKGIKQVTSTTQIIQPLSVLNCQQELDDISAKKPFAFNQQGQLKAESTSSLLSEIAATLNLCPDYRLLIIVHTNNSLGSEENKTLSAKRAQSIKDYLIDQNSIEPNRLLAIGMGASFPIADNQNLEGKSLNERIELKLE